MSDAEYRRRIVSLILAAQLACAPVAQAAELLDRTTGTDPPSPNTTYDVTEDTTVTPVESPSPSESASPRPPPIEGGSTPTPVASPSPTAKEEGEEPSETPEATSTATPEAEPTATPEVTPEVTPTVTPEATPEKTPAATPTPTPEIMPEFAPVQLPSSDQTPPLAMLGSPMGDETMLAAADSMPEKLSGSRGDYGYYSYVGCEATGASTIVEAPYRIEKESTSFKLNSYHASFGASCTISAGTKVQDDFTGWKWSNLGRVAAVRVPDREFAGWYVYLGENTSDKVAWSTVTDTYGPITDATTFGDIWDKNPLFYRSGTGGTRSLRFIGKWDLSSNAEVLASFTDVSDTKYTSGLTLGTGETLVALSTGTPLYTGVVNKDVEEVTLNLLTEEPFLYWGATEAVRGGVTITVNGEPVSTSGVTHTPLNMAEPKDTDDDSIQYKPVNSVKNPARALWTATIPLEMAREDQVYNEIEVTITSPNGEETNTYTFQIQRTKMPEIKLHPGNTPYGLIEANLPEEQWADAKATFDTTGKLPDSMTQNGYYAGEFFHGFDFEKDSDAVVVYTNDSFILPGVTYINGQGQSDSAANPPQLQLTVKEGLETGGTIKGVSYEWITGNKTSTTTRTLTADRNGVWTIPQTVLPGVYALTYQYTDADSTLSAPEVTRKVIVLPRPGDADLDGVVTPADGWALQQVLNKVGTDPTKWNDLQKLYFYRVADVANTDGSFLTSSRGGPDGAVDVQDVNALYGGYVSEEAKLFYPPLEGGKESVPASSTGTGNQGTLYLDYLGKGTAPALAPVDGSLPENRLKKDDVVWVGVRLDNQSVLDSVLYSMSLTLSYDSRYLLPAYQDGDGTWLAADTFQSTMDPAVVEAWKGWLQTNQTGVWRGTNFAYAVPGDRYQQYDRKAPSLLSLEGGYLRELKVSYHDENHLYAAGEENLLLVVPMMLKEQPPMADTLSALDLSLGSGNFSVKTHTAQAAAASQQTTTAWDGAGWLVDDENTNLSKLLNFDRDADTSATTLYLVDDPSNYTDLFAAPDKSNWLYYGSPVADNSYSFQGANSTLEGTLPLGLRYDFQRGKIIGKPLAAGEFTFLVGGVGYRITVHKRPLTLVPQDAEKYYGEPNPTLTFRYDPAEIAEIDQPGEVNNLSSTFACTGDGTELVKLTGYISSVVPGTTATQATGVGNYPISLTGGSNKNYEFVFGAEAELTIHHRPIRVSAITADPVETVRVDATILKFNKVGSSNEDFTAAFPEEWQNGMYQNLPLTGDAVVAGDEVFISYTAAFRPDGNAPVGSMFALSQPREYRDMGISNVALMDASQTGCEHNVNYKLYLTTATTLVGKGLVVDRAVESIRFGGIASANGLSKMEYTYGQKVDFNDLTLILTYEADNGQTPKVETITYARPETLSDRGIHVVLLNQPTDNPTVAANVTAIASGDTMTFDRHHGKYFCVYMQTGLGANDRIVSAVSTNAIQVAQKQLTLSLQRGGAYYGEDPNAPENLPTFMYERDALAPGEVAKLAALGRPTTGPGSAEELAQILTGYTAPTVEVRTAVPTVPNTTKLTAGADCREYFAILKGAQASNYSFAYTQYEISQGTRTDYGTSYYEVEPRPVVIQQLTMEPASGIDGTYFLYDDTTSYKLKEMYYTGGVKRVPTARADGTGANTFVLTQPAGTYFPEGGSSIGPTSLKRPLTGTAIFSGDASGLQVTYRANYVTDRASGNIPTNGNQWFQLADGNASETRPVKISGLTLFGEKAGNYKLVYANNDAAINRAPTDNNAIGLVKLRAIEDMTIVHDPDQMQYTYGDRLDLTGMTLQLTYETQGDNVTLAHNVQNVVFQSLTINGVQTSNFEQRGFALSWEQRSDDVMNYAPLQTARHGDYPTVVEHSGRLLVLTGRRHPSHQLATGTTAAEVIIQKKNLTLTVTDQVRYYGEANSAYEATFLQSDLAQPDQRKVSGAQPQIGELANLTQGLDSHYFKGYTAPTFSTNAKATSSVGVWTLALRSNGSMDNYSFTRRDGTITIQQRPIDVIAVAGTSANNPLYSIYHDDAQSNFTTTVYDTGSICVSTGSVYPTTGSAIVDGDMGKVEFAVSFQYVNRPPFNTGDTVKPCDVNITGVALSTAGTSANYTIRSTAPNMKATAQLDNRPIDKIEVTKNPKLNYLYGETLDLSDMMLKITYQGGGSETKQAIREGRVTFYYSDRKDTISTHVANIRGDHLTIAKDSGGFAHQDKYLVGQASHAGKSVVFSVNQPIRITPLDLTYTLSANDKVYDGTTGTTGTVTLNNLYGNDKVTASAQFDFLDANVKYRTDGYTTNPGDDYWTKFQTDPLRDSANWHEGREVAAMPVLLSNIRLDGADKDNYTIALTGDSLDQAQKGSLDPNRNPVAQDYSIGLTDNLSSADRATVPFATITKADRVPTQAPAQVLVDDRTNVVKVDYNEHTAYETIVTTSQNKNGVADDYAEEIHFEYVLELEQTDGTIRQWAGLDGSDSAQDGRFFGGEAVTPKAPVLIEGEGGGHVPDTEDFPSMEDMTEEDFNFQGQTYRWAEEDAGFRLNTAAYPGGIYRPGYSLYETDRQPLPRAATVWAGVRVAATHNYNASSFLYSVPGETQLLRAQNAAAVADPVSQQRIDELKYYGEEEKWPNGAEVDTFAPEAHAAVNTYAQRLDLISVEEQDSTAQSGTGTDKGTYNVYTLETVQFTDLMDYPEERYMEGVVNGAGTASYSGYYWDENHSAKLDFEGRDTDSTLDLRAPFIVTIEVKEESGTREETMTVNVDNTAEIYVDLSSDSGLILEHSVEIDPSEIVACLGDEPLQLRAKVLPVTATFKSVTWSTSDPSVATVDRKGLVTFVGVGECVITARTRNGETATATVVVMLPEEPVETMGCFNLNYQGAYLWTNELGRVDPERGLTRGELAQLFAQFCIAQEDAKVYEISFPDLEGKDYTVSVELLAALGIVNGTGTGYQGDLLATRAEAVTMLARMLCLDVSLVEDGDYAFGDSRPEDTWAWAYIEAMAEAKLTNGVGESLFAPDRKITYAEVAVLLDRILERTHPEGEGVVLPEGMEADHWAYQSFVKGLNQAPVSENVSQ